MQKELLELELKYGPLEIDLPRDEESTPATPLEKERQASVETKRENEPKQTASAVQAEELSPVAP
eukprot:CAMPEP_0170454060 /NCGR_PEP_ID=MMETSP0123-20130129/2438_1 /TAXON_ID=182087 /ORGANISM="Favella ehrenbergii, Strain Fehren 1" /LENGTH=64 /DNA_ID=CAMNT_0010716647 /DNA_START=3258 /DNA_END=3452 /DNA_ORIENTATION=+